MITKGQNPNTEVHKFWDSTVIEDTTHLSLMLRKCYNQSRRYNSAISTHILLMWTENDQMTW